MSKETRRQTSDYLDYDMALNRGLKLLKSQDKKFKLGFLIVLGINVGLRISDILKLRHGDFQGDTIKLHEKKTGKFREIKINQHVRDAYEIYKTKVRIQSQEDFLFLSKVTKVYSVRHINRELKKVFDIKGRAVSTHSLRKTFGRRVWENDGCSERALVLLSLVYNHSSTQVTRTYLSIQREELLDVYDSL